MMGMLFILLRVRNYKFWSQFGCLGWKINIFTNKGIAWGFTHKKFFIKETNAVRQDCVEVWSHGSQIVKA